MAFSAFSAIPFSAFADADKWYYLNSNGSMRTANLAYKGKVYKFNKSGACLNP